MEVVEVCSKRKASSCTKTMACPCKTKYKRYVQPPRTKSFAPERLYKIPSEQFEDRTTYHLSYLNVDRAAARCARLQPIRPVQAFQKSTGKFFDETTNKLSYQPVWQTVKAEPIIPKRRLLSTGVMETVTTVRHDYGMKHVERPEMIIPCGNIRTSSAPLDDTTMAKMSYVSPGLIEPVISFKPILKYRPSSQALSKETTQKLSYQPFAVVKKEFHPWTQRPVYKPPDVAMCGKTTYSESYMENDTVSMEKPFLPVTACVLPYGAEFADKTIYKESYLPGDTERMEPVVPCGNLFIPDVKMSADTTSKLSYQPVWTEKRKPFLPRVKTTLATAKMQSETTTRCEYVAKTTLRPDLIVPSGNIRTVDVPLEGDTTTGLSYIKPDVIKPVHSYKPVTQYYRPEIKIDCETINKLSYQTWTPQPKEELPWARRSKYQAPEHPMTSDTVYHMSYPVPGHYVEDDSSAKCPCPIEQTE
ncbi:stabilizer of axonemal microtubules 1 [Monomorium pharaonis]|uniref:stabilizer of axonemal microtubules 1 n=1 Tax=Monomorium pharaonis TaxID=307658 RepID=UPI00063F9A85|nr:stabilizer of axonemal microtubules 1 [Monomorium pharaonis]